MSNHASAISNITNLPNILIKINNNLEPILILYLLVSKVCVYHYDTTEVFHITMT